MRYVRGVRDCPWCGAEALSLWSKAWLGYARTVPCRACGAPISVSGWSTLFVLPITAALAGGGLLALKREWWLAVPVFFIGAVPGFVIHDVLPLVKR
jgi:hypothetical protein